MTTAILEARGLTKRYDGRAVVDQLDLVCRKGSVLGLLGANGAGKTTTLRMLYGFVPSDAGAIFYGGKRFDEHRTDVKRRIGVCTQDDSLEYDLTVEQTEFTGRIRWVQIDVGDDAQDADHYISAEDRFQGLGDLQSRETISRSSKRVNDAILYPDQQVLRELTA